MSTPLPRISFCFLSGSVWLDSGCSGRGLEKGQFRFTGIAAGSTCNSSKPKPSTWLRWKRSVPAKNNNKKNSCLLLKSVCSICSAHYMPSTWHVNQMCSLPGSALFLFLSSFWPYEGFWFWLSQRWTLSCQTNNVCVEIPENIVSSVCLVWLTIISCQHGSCKKVYLFIHVATPGALSLHCVQPVTPVPGKWFLMWYSFA